MTKRPQRGPQPPATYTSRGDVPDGYVTWNVGRYEFGIVVDRYCGDCFVYVRDQHGTIRLGGKVTDKHRLN